MCINVLSCNLVLVLELERKWELFINNRRGNLLVGYARKLSRLPLRN